MGNTHIIYIALIIELYIIEGKVKVRLVVSRPCSVFWSDGRTRTGTLPDGRTDTEDFLDGRTDTEEYF